MPDVNALETMPPRPALSATSDTPPEPQPDPPVPEPTPEPEPSPEPVPEPLEPEPAPAPTAADPRKISTRMSELAAQRRAAEEARAAADARADKLAALVESLVAERTKPPEPPKPTEVPRPVREQFADPDSYDTALIEWASGQAAARAAQQAAETIERRQVEARAAAEKAQTEEAARKQLETMQASYAEKRAKMIETHPDFVEVAEGDFPVSETMVPPLMMAENGPAVLYYLGQHREESARISGLNPLQQAIEIGKISARLAESPRATPSKLPPPIVPVGSRNGAAPKSPDEMSTEEYAALRLPQLRAERTAGMWGRAKQN